jgi:CRP-like cAMP-binding protein
MLDQLHRPRNRLIDALPPGPLAKLRPALEHVACTRDQVLIEADAALDQIYFPESSVVSLTTVFADGTAANMASIGREGCTGVPALLGAKVSSVRLLTHIPGTAMRTSRRAFAWALETLPDFRTLMCNYGQAFLHQAMISGACNGAHRLSQRLARWLLTTHDRRDSDSLPVTQNLLADLLGVQRQSINNALSDMESARLIESARQQITILDRRGLAEESCECYQRLRDRLAFHLPMTYAAT